MGLFRIPVSAEKVEALPATMQELGYPVVRIQKEVDAVYYFCLNPKRANKNWMCWITSDDAGRPRYFQCGISQFSKRVIGSLNFQGFFPKEPSR